MHEIKEIAHVRKNWVGKRELHSRENREKMQARKTKENIDVKCKQGY